MSPRFALCGSHADAETQVGTRRDAGAQPATAGSSAGRCCANRAGRVIDEIGAGGVGNATCTDTSDREQLTKRCSRRRRVLERVRRPGFRIDDRGALTTYMEEACAFVATPRAVRPDDAGNARSAVLSTNFGSRRHAPAACWMSAGARSDSCRHRLPDVLLV